MSHSQSKRELIREKRKAQKRQRTITFTLVIFAAAVLIGLAAFLPKLLLSGTKYQNTQGFSVGDPNAPVKVEEFSNFQCGHCQNFALNMEEDFIREYVETGKVYFTFVNFPFGSESVFAATEATYCAADQNKLYEYKELLFQYAGYPDAFTDEALVNYAKTAGLDANKFEECLKSDVHAETYLEDLAYVQSVGITATPTFLVNGEIVYSSELIPKVEELLAQLEN